MRTKLGKQNFRVQHIMFIKKSVFTNFSSNLPTEVLFCESCPSLDVVLVVSEIVSYKDLMLFA